MLPVGEHGEQFLRLLRLDGRQIAAFADVLPQVVQLQAAVFEVLDQLPVAQPHDTARSRAEKGIARFVQHRISLQISREMPEQRPRSERRLFAGQQRHDAHPVADLILRHRRPGHLTQGRVQIDADDRFVAYGPRLHDAGPFHEKRLADTAFVVRSLVTAQRIHVGRLVESAVVGIEDHDRVFGQSQFVERAADEPDAVVDGLDHRGVLHVVVQLPRCLRLVFR